MEHFPWKVQHLKFTAGRVTRHMIAVVDFADQTIAEIGDAYVVVDNPPLDQRSELTRLLKRAQLIVKSVNKAMIP